jgi:hypothetical protein
LRRFGDRSLGGVPEAGIDDPSGAFAHVDVAAEDALDGGAVPEE